MPEPKTLGRVDWMSRLKVWRVIRYKGAADIPAGDYPTKEEAEDALRKLVARSNPGDTPEVTRISPTYENLAEGQILIDQAGDRWLITGIKKEGVPSRWGYTLKGETINLTRTRPLGEVERYYKMEQPAIPATTPELGQSIAKELGVKYDGVQEGIGMQFTDPQTGSTTYGNTLEEVRTNLANMRAKFAKHSSNPGFTVEEAKTIGKELGIDFKGYDVEQFRQGLNVELEHCNVTNCDPLLTGKIAQAHLNELPDYYTRLAKMEEASRMYNPDKIEAGHKGTKAPVEKGSLEQKANALLPMSPENGPPLPRGLQLKWPWKK